MDRSVDYDARRDRTKNIDDDSRQVIKDLRGDTHSEIIDEDDQDTPHEIVGGPVADPSMRSGEPTVPVVPVHAGEFTCCRCFLICSSGRLARSEQGQTVCRDCG